MSLLRKGAITRRGGAPPIPVLIDYFDVTQNALYGLTRVFPCTVGRCSVGQSLAVDKARKITSAKFGLRKELGSPVGNLVAVLYNITGTHGTDAKPTGDPLATSDPIPIEDLTGTVVNYEFAFPKNQQYKMEVGYFGICVQVQSATVLDSDNYPTVASRYGALATHSGNFFECWKGVWYADADYDCIFYVYGV